MPTTSNDLGMPTTMQRLGHAHLTLTLVFTVIPNLVGAFRFRLGVVRLGVDRGVSLKSRSCPAAAYVEAQSLSAFS